MPRVNHRHGMNKLWHLDYDFDKEDAKIAVPLILLVLGLIFTQLRKDWLLAGAAAYYALYFFVPPQVAHSKFRVLCEI